MQIGSLFSGVGGLELGLEWAGLGETVWQVELSDYCNRVLEKHWPGVTRYRDVKTCFNLPRVDLICGGFPCQDVSSAGKGAGLSGARSGLWYEYLRIVSELRPRIVVVENVASGKRRWLCEVRSNLHELGYRTEALGVSARDVGANHIRERIFVVGHANRHSEPTLPVHAEVARVQEHAERLRHWRTPKPGNLRMVDGVSNGLDRLGAVGNAVVPQQSMLVGHWIKQHIPQ